LPAENIEKRGEGRKLGTVALAKLKEFLSELLKIKLLTITKHVSKIFDLFLLVF